MLIIEKLENKRKGEEKITRLWSHPRREALPAFWGAYWTLWLLDWSLSLLSPRCSWDARSKAHTQSVF